MKLQSIVIFLALLGIIGSSLGCSCMRFKEGFDMITQWKAKGELPWDGPFSVPTATVPNGWFFANNKSSPECCKAATYRMPLYNKRTTQLSKPAWRESNH